MIGLERGKAILCDHDPAWDTEARRTADMLKSILSDRAKIIEHIGSTAVKNIKAKPIIDMVVAVTEFADVVRFDSELEANGFYYRHAVDGAGNFLRGEVDFDTVDVRQLLYACGGYYDGSDCLQTHFIHVVKTDSVDLRDYLAFRDRLNADNSVAKEYEKLKMALCAEYADDRAEYTARKHDFIRRVLNGACIR